MCLTPTVPPGPPPPGVRFNAEKKAVGKYFSTKIWSFTMTAPCCKEARCSLPSCHFCPDAHPGVFMLVCRDSYPCLPRPSPPCPQVIEVHTDPKAAEYLLVRGARVKVEEYSAEAAGTAELRSKEEVEAVRANPFARLETGLGDAQRAKAAAPTIAELRHVQTERSRDDYALNKQLRRAMRAERGAQQQLGREHAALNLPAHIPLLAASAADAEAARSVRFGAPGGGFERGEAQRRDDRRDILSAPLLAAGPAAQAHAAGAAAAGPGKKASAAARELAEAADRRAELMAKRRRLEQNGVVFGGGGGASGGKQGRAAGGAAGADPFGGAFGAAFGGSVAQRVTVRAVPKQQGLVGGRR